MTTAPRKIGIVSAMHHEQTGLLQAMQNLHTDHVGMRDYSSGTLWGEEVVCVLSRLGKVAASATVATLIARFGVTEIVFTGVAGAVSTKLQVGDIAIGDTLVQHDMDASPLFPRYQIPLLNQSVFASDRFLSDRLAIAAAEFMENDLVHAVAAEDREAFHLGAPQVRRGLIASGDEFVDSRTRLAALRSAFPDMLAVEMEGAAVAQVCFEFGLPFAVIRTISDGANENASIDFMRFIDRVAGRYAFGTVKRFLEGRARA